MRQITLGDRFWSKVRKGPKTDCWPWMRSKGTNGYGMFSWGHANWKPAHRVAFFLAYNRWPAPGMVVCHHCDNSICCNPDHLFEGTPKDNVHDCIARGRMHKPHPEANGEGNHAAKLTWSIVRKIRLASREYGSQIVLANKYGVQRDAIRRIWANETWIESLNRRRGNSRSIDGVG